MSRGRRNTLIVVAVVLAAGVGVGIATGVSSDNSSDKAKTVTTKQTVTSTNVATQAPTTTTAATTTESSTSTITATGTAQQSTVTVSASSASEAATYYAQNNMNVTTFKQLTTVNSRSNASYAIVSGFENGKPVAVWVKRSGDKWTALAGTDRSQPAPKGKGIPDDIKFPFSESDGGHPIGPKSAPTKPGAPSIPRGGPKLPGH